MMAVRILPFLSLLVPLLFGILFYTSTLEDAQITFRYSMRWSEGYAFGLWNRSGSPVEGFTTLSWMAFLSFFGPGRDLIAHAAKITGILSHVAIVILFFVASQRRATEFGDWSSWAFAAAAFAVSASVSIGWYAASGMETIFYSLLVTATVVMPLLTRSPAVLIVLALVIVLTRPEGILAVGLAYAGWWYHTRERALAIALVAAVAAFTALTLFRMFYFGVPLPNTYYAKSGTLSFLDHVYHGIDYFISGARYYAVLTLAVLVALIRAVKNRNAPAFGILAFVFITYLPVMKAGGDNVFAFPFYRHIVVTMPLLFLAIFLVLSELRPRSWIAVAFVGTLQVTTALWPNGAQRLADEMALELPLRNEFTRFRAIHWLAEKTDADTVIATSLAGQLPFLVDAVHIDILGLNDTAVAHRGTFDPNGPVDSKTDMKIVLNGDPDIIEAYMPANAILNGEYIAAITQGRMKMNIELLSDPRFARDFVILVNAPYEDFNRILFVRRDWAAARDSLQTIPVKPLVDAVFAL